MVCANVFSLFALTQPLASEATQFVTEDPHMDKFPNVLSNHFPVLKTSRINISLALLNIRWYHQGKDSIKTKELWEMMLV